MRYLLTVADELGVSVSRCPVTFDHEDGDEARVDVVVEACRRCAASWVEVRLEVAGPDSRPVFSVALPKQLALAPGSRFQFRAVLTMAKVPLDPRRWP